MFYLYSLTVLYFVIRCVQSGKEHIDGACHDPLYFGDSPCDQKWSIRYHLDVATETCLAFNFTGCGENWNNFEDVQACFEECIPLDHQICPAASKIHKTLTGENICKEDCDCGLGRYCNLGQGYGQCCEEDIRDQVDSDYNPKCPAGTSVVEYKLNGVTRKLIGKSCAHNFCPLGSTCSDGFFFATCCQ